MDFKLISKNNVGTAVLLLLAIALSQSKAFNFLIDTASSFRCFAGNNFYYEPLPSLYSVNDTLCYKLISFLNFLSYKPSYQPLSSQGFVICIARYKLSSSPGFVTCIFYC